MSDNASPRYQGPTPPVRYTFAVLTLALLALVARVIWLHSAQALDLAPAASPTFSSQQPTPSVSFLPGLATSPSSCQATGGRPDPSCTPGATDPTVTQENIATTICTAGYTRTVRPPTSYTNRVKLLLMHKYNLSGDPQDFELDHFIPLELGGAPSLETNLWPEVEQGDLGALSKDRVENYLHAEVCAGRMSLQQAQQAISQDWTAVYRQMP